MGNHSYVYCDAHREALDIGKGAGAAWRGDGDACVRVLRWIDAVVAEEGGDAESSDPDHVPWTKARARIARWLADHADCTLALADDGGDCPWDGERLGPLWREVRILGRWLMWFRFGAENALDSEADIARIRARRADG